MRPLLAATVLLVLPSLGCAGPPESPERRFHFEYRAEVREVPGDARGVRIWVPLPRDDEAQTIANLHVSGPGPYRETRS